MRNDILLRQCIVWSAKGASFYDIYDELLRPSALVANGIATTTVDAAPVHKVPLRAGGSFVFNEATKRWSIDRRGPLLR